MAWTWIATAKSPASSTAFVNRRSPGSGGPYPPPSGELTTERDMKAKVKIEKEIEIKAVLIEIAPRHIGDSDDDDMPAYLKAMNVIETVW